MNEWIPVIATLSGTLVGGILSILASALKSSKEEKTETRNIILQKLEETHLVTRTIRDENGKSFQGVAQLLITGKAQTTEPKPSEMNRLFMLIGFYFPELLPTVETLNEERNKLGVMVANAIVAATKDIQSREQTLDPLAKQTDKINAICDELMQELASLARQRLKL